MNKAWMIAFLAMPLFLGACSQQDIQISSDRSQSPIQSTSNANVSVAIGGRISDDGQIQVTPVQSQVLTGGGVELHIGIQ